MQHSEVEELLPAYALDAVDPEEAVAVEEHLRDCPRCRAEVARHRDVAGLFASSPETPPAELWERISAALSEPDPAYDGAAPTRVAGVVPLAPRRAAGRRRLAFVGGGLGAVAAAAAALAIVLSVQVSHLNGRVAQMQAALGSRGLDSAVAAALVSPHRDAVLTSATARAKSAEVVLTPSGEAYWVRSSLPRLSASQTYQLWALVDGKPVSIGLIGADPSRYAAFRVGHGTTALMVTAEPAGGTAVPTTPVIVQKTLSA